MAAQLLTPRERDIATLCATGDNHKMIAQRLAISEKTVKNTHTEIFVKTNSRSRTERVVQLIRAAYSTVVKTPGLVASWTDVRQKYAQLCQRLVLFVYRREES